MEISPLNKYYFEKSYIVDKHDPNHDKRTVLHTLILCVFLVAHVYALIPDWPPGVNP